MLDLQLRPAARQLEHHPQRRAAKQHGDQHQGYGENLGQGEGEVRGGRRIDDLVHAPFPFAPDQFPGIEDRHDHRNKGEGAPQNVDDAPGDRIDIHLIGARRKPQAAARIKKGEGHQNDEGRAFEDLGGVKPGPRQNRRRPVRIPDHRGVVTGRQGGVGRGGGRKRLVPVRSFAPRQRSWPFFEPIETDGDHQNGEADAQPQEMVQHQKRIRRQGPRIALKRGPVFG